MDAEVRRILEEQYNVARKLIEDNKDKMHRMAKALLDWETIDSDQIDDIMAGREPRPPKSASGTSNATQSAETVAAAPTQTQAPAEASSQPEVREPTAENTGDTKIDVPSQSEEKDNQ